MLDPISLPQAPPELRGRRVVLRDRKPSDIDDRLAFPIVPEDEDMFGGSWRREWGGDPRLTRERLEALAAAPAPPGYVEWAADYAGRCIGWAGLRIDAATTVRPIPSASSTPRLAVADWAARSRR